MPLAYRVKSGSISKTRADGATWLSCAPAELIERP